ncbi:MAG: GIY-YIG nuclease family protein [Candidatus Magasanikbacteria bacterium]
MNKSDKKDLYKDLPETPGVYIMKDSDDQILYIGKAANLKKRVSSYFTGAHERRTEELVRRIDNIDYKKTDSSLEALIVEANLIKKHQPPFNIREKDDKSFLWVRIKDSEEYPRVLLSRGSRKVANKGKGSWFGPFTNASDIRSALKTLRKIFPYNTHKPSEIGSAKRECMYA